MEYFLQFFPYRLWGDEVFGCLQSAYSALGDRHNVGFTRGKLLLFIGILLRMAMFGLPVEKYWTWDGPACQTFSFCQKMSLFVWKMWWRFIRLPGDATPGEAPDTTAPQGAKVASFMEQLFKHWREAWNAGDYLVVDESMVFWTGLGDLHITYLPRKPTPFGIMLKTACCAASKVMLAAEVVEGKVVDATKKWFAETGATTSCTLRLVEPYKGTGRVVIGDSWFGSCKTAEWLLDVMGLYSILSVKIGHKGFPKSQIKAALAGAEAEATS